MSGGTSFDAKRELTTIDGQELSYFSLSAVEEAGYGSMERLPFTIRILLESVLRNCDGFAVTDDHVKMIASWKPKDAERKEIPYKPARVVLQDFTGVPAIVDLAVMRDAMKDLGGDPAKINPMVRCDLVIDHSVQVDYFGRKDALALNEKIEFQRNKERYEFLKWGQSAFENFRVVPPATGIVHQVNLEYLSEGLYWNRATGMLYPDSCVGTDSHTPMVNGLGVLAWGVGGIEAEAVMLDQPIYMLVPDVIGFKLTGELPEGATATDLVLRIVEQCREFGVVGKFVEFFGPGLKSMTVADRATIGNMAPEQGCTVSFFPIDDQTLKYMRLTGRPEEMVELTEQYSKAQGLFRTDDTPDPEFTEVLTLDLSTIEPAVAGPKRPQDRIPLRKVGSTYIETLQAPVGPKGLGLSDEDLRRSGEYLVDGETVKMDHGAVVIAAITSCTNTSNPSVMLGAGLLAKKALEKGLKVKPYVKTSLAPGSTVVTEYLTKSGLLEPLEQLGFHLVGYGCTTCIGNSGPLPQVVEETIKKNDLVVSAVLSGNRNFEGRVHPLTRTNYLASPPLVVAYALLGTTAKDIVTESLGVDSEGKDVFLKDIWPTTAEVNDVVSSFVDPEMFRSRYADVFKGSKTWQAIETSKSQLYPWREDSTYIQKPPFFDLLSKEAGTIESISGARALALFGDSVTTDHISPAGSIAVDSPAAEYLRSCGVKEADFNSYGSRRGNDRVMKRGTFANIRIKNRLVPGKEGNYSLHHPSGEVASFFDTAERYAKDGTALIVLAGKEYGSGSSRDWAAKGPFLLGLKATIAVSYERIHRSNLIGMGILPLQFKDGESAETIGLDGTETFDIPIGNDMLPGADVEVTAVSSDGKEKNFTVVSRIDTPVEIQYFRDGGILCTVLKKPSQIAAFAQTSSSGSSSVVQPLAERMRPQTLDEVVGQDAAVGPNSALGQMVRRSETAIPSVILWGPPGTGKTTIARVIAQTSGHRFVRLSGVLDGVKELRAAVVEAQQAAELEGRATLALVDEIHRFNKSQQDAFLPHVESGLLTVIGQTTENVSFRIRNALLSRMRVIALELLSKEVLEEIIHKALNDSERGLGEWQLDISSEATAFLANCAAGDARRALNGLEWSAVKARADGLTTITKEIAEEAFGSQPQQFDQDGDYHFDCISAFIKSMRGSDPDAALFYMLKALEGGEDPLYLTRRMMIFASEECGCDPRALEVAVNVDRAVERVGLPQGKIPMAQAAVYLACCSKSNASYLALNKMEEVVKNNPAVSIPKHLRNAPTEIMKDLGNSIGYKYPHDFPGGFVPERYLPAELGDLVVYEPTDRALDGKVRERIDVYRAKVRQANK